MASIELSDSCPQQTEIATTVASFDEDRFKRTLRAKVEAPALFIACAADMTDEPIWPW